MRPRPYTAALAAVLLLAFADGALAKKRGCSRGNCNPNQNQINQDQIKAIQQAIQKIDNNIDNVDREITGVKKVLAAIPAEKAQWTRKLEQAKSIVDQTESERDRQRQLAAEAQQREREALDTLMQSFDNSGDIQRLTRERKEAESTLQALEQELLQPVRRSQAYLALQKTIEDTRAKIRESQRTGDGSAAPLATKLIQTQSQLRQMERDACASDSRYAAARETFDRTNTDLAKRRSELTDQVKNHSDVVTQRERQAAAMGQIRTLSVQIIEQNKDVNEAQRVLGRIETASRRAPAELRRLDSRKQVLQRDLRNKERQMSDLRKRR